MVAQSGWRRQHVWLARVIVTGSLCALYACGGSLADGPDSLADDAGLHSSTDTLGADADDAGHSTTDGSGHEGVVFSCPQPPLLPDGTSCASWSLGSRCDYPAGDQPGYSGVCACVAMHGTRVWSCEVVAVPFDAGLGGESTNDSGSSCEHDTCGSALDAAAESGASKDANADASFACGAQRCVSGQLCLYTLAGGPVECSPLDDAGGCPSGYDYVPSCANLSDAAGCQPRSTIQADSCVSIPSACSQTPTCACMPLGTCPSFAGQCIAATEESITCASE